MSTIRFNDEAFLTGKGYIANPKQVAEQTRWNKEIDTYVVTDDQFALNQKHIRWIKKMEDCLSVCSKSDGCEVRMAHKICKDKSPAAYEKLNRIFEKSL